MDPRSHRRGRSRRRFGRPPVIGHEIAELAASAAESCTRCGGFGYYHGSLCQCAGRRIFRSCLEAYHEFGANPWAMPTHLYAVNRGGGFLNQVRIAQEYRADLEHVARVALPDERHRSIFTAMLRGADYREIGRIGRVVGRSVFHLIYRIQHMVGMAAAAAQLWPTKRYFGRDPFVSIDPHDSGPRVPKVRQQTARKT